MFAIISQILKYVFIVIIYAFIFSILRLIYMDIRSTGRRDSSYEGAYLKVVNRLDALSFKMDEYYNIKNSITIGRSSKNDIAIRDTFVSKTHMRIYLDKGIYFIEDFDSANGTYLNGERINDIIELQNGDNIEVGMIKFLFVDTRG